MCPDLFVGAHLLAGPWRRPKLGAAGARLAGPEPARPKGYGKSGALTLHGIDMHTYAYAV